MASQNIVWNLEDYGRGVGTKSTLILKQKKKKLFYLGSRKSRCNRTVQRKDDQIEH